MDKKTAPEVTEELDESVEGHAAVNFRPLDTGPQGRLVQRDAETTDRKKDL